MIKTLLRAARLLDDHWVGDLLGVLILFFGGYGMLLLSYGMDAP